MKIVSKEEHSKLPSIEFVQIYGERNSGTNFLSKSLISMMKYPKNFLGLNKSDDLPNGTKLFGYKHWFVPEDKLASVIQKKTLFVVVYRNPYTWLKAMLDRPYALSKCLENKDIKDLPATKLFGEINGKKTQNEFHPISKLPINIFELRKLKIESFRNVQNLVDHVVCIRLEELVKDPLKVLTQLTLKFDCFNKIEKNSVLNIPQVLKEECLSPRYFSSSDEQIINNNIDWETENKVGYEVDNYFLKKGKFELRKLNFLILHGSSSVGKTHNLRKLMKQFALYGLEMDDARYWDDYEPDFSIHRLKSVFPNISKQQYTQLIHIIEKVGVKSKRNIDFLFTRLAELFEDCSVKDEIDDIIIATCGALPFPDQQEDTIYSWLENQISIKFRHVLIQIEHREHEERMKLRGRHHLKDKIFENNEGRKKVLNSHDIVVSGFDEIVKYIESIDTEFLRSRELNSENRNMLVRKVSRNTKALKNIQIFGERNSGTNHLRRLVEENMKEPMNFLGSYATKTNPENTAKRFGYKHYYPNPDKLNKNQADTLFLVIYKNPYTWFRSMLVKPYHFKADLEGKTLLQLPKLKLDGRNVNGLKIPDVHPETGEDIDIFQLRSFKVKSWENLANLVNNVVFVNYETLLLKPTEIIQEILNEYPVLFKNTTAPFHKTEPMYLDKYVTPEPFSTEEMETMDQNIDWATEENIGYKKGNVFI